MTILLVTVLFFVIMGLVIGADLKESIFVGACISLSSTAVVVKCIKLDQLDHLYGLLVMQDVILGFMLVSFVVVIQKYLLITKVGYYSCTV